MVEEREFVSCVSTWLKCLSERELDWPWLMEVAEGVRKPVEGPGNDMNKGEGNMNDEKGTENYKSSKRCAADRGDSVSQIQLDPNPLGAESISS